MNGETTKEKRINKAKRIPNGIAQPYTFNVIVYEA